MEYLANTFKVSLVIFLFMCGIMIGRETEAKASREKEKLVAEEDILYKEQIAGGAEGIEVYFDSFEEGTINLIVKNHTGNKLQEVSIMDMEINGKKIGCYSFLDGVYEGEIKRCPVGYDADSVDIWQNDTVQVKGNLYIRGGGNIFHQKIEITVALQM